MYVCINLYIQDVPTIIYQKTSEVERKLNSKVLYHFINNYVKFRDIEEEIG